MEKEKLNDNLTEEVAGGTDVQSKFKGIREILGLRKINVKCAKCGKEFEYFEDGPMGMTAIGLIERDIQKRTCPHCGHVNSAKELGI